MKPGRAAVLTLVVLAGAGCGRRESAAPTGAPEMGDESAADDTEPADAGEVSGAVTDEFGVPARGVDVAWTSDDGATTRAARTGADGAFRFADVPPDLAGAVRLAGARRESASPAPARAGAHDVHVVVPRARTTISGRLLADGDAPPKRRFLLFVPENPRLAPFVPQAKGSATVLADGAFSIPAAVGVEYEVSLSAGDHEIALGRFAAGAHDVELRTPTDH